jgi:hypothetical protein
VRYRNINKFLETIDDVLDTPAKQTLWFHIIPLLDEDDQEHAKRKLCILQSRGSILADTPNFREVFGYETNTSRAGMRGEFDYLTDNEIDALFDLPADRDGLSSLNFLY